MSDTPAPRESEKPPSILAAFNQASVRIMENHSLKSVLQATADSARSLTGAKHAAVATFDDSRAIQRYTESSAEANEHLRETLQNLGCLEQTSQPIRSDRDAPHAKPFIAVPINDHKQTLGSICIYDNDRNAQFDQNDETLLTLLASQATVAIHNAARHEQEQRDNEILETERQRLDALVETSPIGVIVVDAKTRIIQLVNQEAKRIFGVPARPGSSIEEFYNVAIYRKIDGREYPVEERPLARALNHGEDVRAEEILLDNSSGASTLVLANATPIRSENGDIISGVAVIQDMTPIEEIERSRNDFLAMVSHELRTPLTTIKGCTSVVLSSTEPLHISEILQYFRMIDEQSDRLRGLVNNLLDMTRIEAGMLSITPKPCDVNTLVEQVKAAFSRRGSQNRIETDFPPDLPLITADNRRITQVMDNLLSNASKYSPAGSTISVTAYKDDVHVYISVMDQGRGIPADQIMHLFKKFSRIDSDVDRADIAGEGLGLAICKGIVEAHGGRIWAESRDDEAGTRITFTIPAASEPDEDSHIDEPSESANHRTPILVVDDDPQVSRLLRNILAGNGYKPVSTGNPDEMIGLLENHSPHLVLLDLIIPGTSGFELMQRVQQVSDAPIIILSANDEEENVVKALELGAYDYIAKPFAATELLARINTCMRKRQALQSRLSQESYQIGDLIILPDERKASIRGRHIPLSAIEYKLLTMLSSSAGRVLTHHQILESVWGDGYSGDGQLLRSTIKNLRQKLGDNANNPRYIFTENRVGYFMAKPQHTP